MTALTIEQLESVFNALPGATDEQQAQLLSSVYADDVLFTDPVHTVQGLAALQANFARQYRGVQECRFAFRRVNEVAGFDDLRTWYIEWDMSLRHPRLNGGKAFSLPGISCVDLDERIFAHRDYFDLSAMLHQRIPVLGAINRKLVERLQ